MTNEYKKAHDLLIQFESISAQAARIYASSGDSAYLRIQLEAEYHKRDILCKLKDGFYNNRNL